MSATAKAIEHYAGMAAEAMSSRRAADERMNRIALMRLAIDNLVKANLLALEAALEPPEDQARCAALLDSTRARVERLIGEMR